MPVFSERYGLRTPTAIRYRSEFPNELRMPILEILRSGSNFRFIVDRAQAVFDPYRLGHLPHYAGHMVVRKEDTDESVAAKRIFLGCEWFQVYDLVEDILGQMYFYEEQFAQEPEEFHLGRVQDELNTFFRAAGIGWQIEQGKVVSREEGALENALADADACLATTGRDTSRKHLAQARAALSHRPDPNTSGAIYHAMGALEGVARDVTSNEGDTLGQIIKRHPDLLPKPLDESISKLWGYASNEARHVAEGHEPQRHEAELVVGLASVVISYLNQKTNSRQ